ncbi:MAG: cupin domain-containing protein [Candidatus Thioglobus sp.]|nr:cupin domain-containing protein [Candidatus Thioglobus sp.]
MEFDLNELDKGSVFLYIDEGGRDHIITKEEALFKVSDCIYTVKVEGMEHLCQESSSVHLFISPKGAASFSPHTDDVDLEIRCVEGVKEFDVDGIRHTLNIGDSLRIDKGVRHRGINNQCSITLSIQV